MNEPTTYQNFLAELQKEAKEQAKLSNSRILPPQLDTVTSIIGRYPWQITCIVSFITAFIVAVVKRA